MLEGLLQGKVALITGAARGIGKAIAMKLASSGADIAFTDLKEDDNFRNTVAEISATWRGMSRICFQCGRFCRGPRHCRTDS